MAKQKKDVVATAKRLANAGFKDEAVQMIKEPELKPVTVQQIAKEIAADVKGLRPVRNKCLVCGMEYDANMITLNGKDTGKITPPRCPKHQTKHLTDLRVNKTMKDIKLLSNLRGRLSAEQRQAVLDSVSDAIMGLANIYSGVQKDATGFSLKV